MNKVKIPKFKYENKDLFNLDFHINDSLLAESVKSIAISTDSRKIYVKMCDMCFEDIFTFDLIKYKRNDINKLTLSILDRSGNIIDEQDFDVKIIDIASFDFCYDRQISDILVVFEY